MPWLQWLLSKRGAQKYPKWRVGPGQKAPRTSNLRSISWWFNLDPVWVKNRCPKWHPGNWKQGNQNLQSHGGLAAKCFWRALALAGAFCRSPRGPDQLRGPPGESHRHAGQPHGADPASGSPWQAAPAEKKPDMFFVGCFRFLLLLFFWGGVLFPGVCGDGFLFSPRACARSPGFTSSISAVQTRGRSPCLLYQRLQEVHWHVIHHRRASCTCGCGSKTNGIDLDFAPWPW